MLGIRVDFTILGNSAGTKGCGQGIVRLIAYVLRAVHGGPSLVFSLLASSSLMSFFSAVVLWMAGLRVLRVAFSRRVVEGSVLISVV